jgi:hypothetical protein
VVLLAVLALPLVVVTASPSSACSCVQGGVERQMGRADVVFVGTVEQTFQVDRGMVGLVAEVAVSRVHKGSVPERTDVVTGGGGGDCGVDFLEGDHVLVLGTLQEDAVHADLCSGTGTDLHEGHPSLGSSRAPEPGALVSSERPVDEGMPAAVWWLAGGAAFAAAFVALRAKRA